MMGLLGSGQRGQPRYSGKLHNLQFSQAVFGTTAPIIFGTRRVAGKLAFYGGFYATKAPNSGGKGIFGGKSTQFLYYADVQICLASGSATAGCQGIVNVWDQNGKLQNQSGSLVFTVPPGGGSVSPVSGSAPPIQQDLGVSKASAYSVTANDYGAGGSTTLTGTQQIPFALVSGTPGAGQYAFNPTTSTYTFAAADAGAIVTISYTSVFSLYYYVETQAAQVPAVGPYQISTNNQPYFASDQGVVLVSTGAALNHPSDYTESGGVYTFNSSHAGQYVYLTYSYTSNNPNITNSSHLNLTFFGGTRGQTPWSYMTSKYPGAAFGYTGLCYVGSNPMALGESATLPNYNYEVVGLVPFGGGNFDAHPCDAFKILLSDALIGIGFPVGNIDAWTNCRAYWAANNYFISMTLDTQTSVASAMGQVIETGNVAPVWSGSVLKLIPYGDTTAVGNGFTYTPPTTPAATLTWNDLLPPSDIKAGQSTNTDPLQISQRAPQDCYNYVQAQWCNRTNDYNNELINEQNDAFIQTYGVRIESPQTWDFLTTQAAATWALNLRLKRQCYIRNEYKFWLPFRFARLEAMDMVVLPTGEAVRLTQVADDPNGRLAIEAEQWSYGSADVTLYPKQAPSSYQPNISQALPGNSVPVFVQNTGRQASGLLNKLQISATGQNPNWGGCNVLVSQDGVSFSLLGPVTTSGIVGLLTAALPSGSDPDTTDTLSVDITQAIASNQGAELVSVTLPQADNFISLCAIVDPGSTTVNELVSYETAALTAQGRYNLTYLRRGAYGSTNGSHAIGSWFAYLGPYAIFLDYQYGQQFVGQTLYLKFQSFNLANNQLQDLSQLKIWQIQLTSQGSAIEESYLPTTNGVVTTGTGSVTNPTNAYDGDFTTAAVINSGTGTSILNLSGFAAFTTPPLSTYTLYGQISYTIGHLAQIVVRVSLDGGATFSPFFQLGGIATSNTQVAFVVPGGQLLSNVWLQVEGISGAGASAVINVFEAWIQ